MEKYKNLTGVSGIVTYKIADDSITIKFKDGGTYLYTNRKPGAQHVKKMKEMAVKGYGLATYINIFVRENFDKQLA
jgi:hypothetical protein